MLGLGKNCPESNFHEPRRRLDPSRLGLRFTFIACGFFAEKRPLESTARDKLPLQSEGGMVGDRYVPGTGGVADVFGKNAGRREAAITIEQAPSIALFLEKRFRTFSGILFAGNGFADAGDFRFQFTDIFFKRLDAQLFQILFFRFLFFRLQIICIHCLPPGIV